MCIALLSWADRSCALIGIDDAIEIIQLGKAITSGVMEVWDIVEQTSGGQRLELPFRNQKQKKILSRVVDLSRKIDYVEATVSAEIIILHIVILSFMLNIDFADNVGSKVDHRINHTIHIYQHQI